VVRSIEGWGLLDGHQWGLSYGHGQLPLHYSDEWDAPGHHAVTTDASGQDRIAYHAIDPAHPDQPAVDARKRPMIIDRLDWVDGWPEVAGDSPSSGPTTAPAARPSAVDVVRRPRPRFDRGGFSARAAGSSLLP
jgi:hypothetical protein